MKRLIFLLSILSVFFTQSLFAQFEDYEQKEIKHEKITKKSEKDSSKIFGRTVIGGDFNLAFGTITAIQLSPTVGFYVTSWSLAGAYVSYEYFKSKSMNYSDSRYGAGVLVELYPIEWLVLHGENGLTRVYDYQNYKYLWTYDVFAGAGFRQKFGKKSMVNYLFLFNINKNPYFPPTMYKLLFLF